jgi:hypothetical protein
MRYPPLWSQGLSYPAQLDRYLLGALWPGGGVLGGAVTAVANTMNMSIAPGSAGVPLQAGQGTALCHWDAAELVTLDAAPPTGQSRVDLIVAQVRDAAVDGGPNNDFVFVVIGGTPATLAETRPGDQDDDDATPPATPEQQAATPPALPPNCYPLAQVTVPGGAANLNGVAIFDLRGPLAVGGLLTQKVVTSASQVDVAVGGTYACWDSAVSELPFVAPASGAVILAEEMFITVGSGGVFQAGWLQDDGSIWTGTGPAQCPPVGVMQPVGVRYDGRVHVRHRIYGLTPGKLYRPRLNTYSGGGVVSHYYYGGNGSAPNSGVGPILLTATVST